MTGTTQEPMARWMSERDVAEAIGISYGTLAAWRSRGREEIPYYRFGGRVMYDRADVERYIAAARVDRAVGA